jgi:hypothetical protein
VNLIALFSFGTNKKGVHLMAAISAPVSLPPQTIQMAQHSKLLYDQKYKEDPIFHDFIEANKAKITKLFSSIDTLFKNLETASNNREIAMKIFNGPVEVIIVRPATSSQLALGTMEAKSDRKPLDEKKFHDTITGWRVGLMSNIEYYLTYGALDQSVALLNAGEETEVKIFPSSKQNINVKFLVKP